MKIGKYGIGEMREFLRNMSGMYDLVRVVDPIECRIIELGEDGRISMEKSCYGIWNSKNKCANCSSANACRTGCHQEKTEYFKNNIYHIQSNPVTLTLSDGGTYDAVVELVSVSEAPEGFTGDGINDRESENKGDKAIKYRVLHDSLTGMLDAEAFYEGARELIIENPDTSWKLIIGDILQFRLINSLFGVEKGNEILFKTAELLKKLAGDNSGMCSRLYRDKFAVLMPSDKYSEDMLTETAKAIGKEFSTGTYTVRLKFGVYDIPDKDIPVSVMCDRANLAIKSKDNYGSTVAYFDDVIMQKSIDEQKVVSGFESALAEGQIKMYLQPIVKKDGRVLGAEALARWILPDGTVVPPPEFIETLEKAALIHKLDRNIWEQAVKLLKSWKNTEKQALTISVNLSVKDFYSMDVYKVLTELMEGYGVGYDKLRLEITESVLIEDPENIYPVVAKLKNAGFLVEIDDFGKGQSSLSLLKDIDVDILKIDKEFLHETENAERSRIILRSVIAMAKELGMKVISEGVETDTQLEYLKSMGCNYFQGYYFSKPVPVDEFEGKYAMKG